MYFMSRKMIKHVKGLNIDGSDACFHSVENDLLEILKLNKHVTIQDKDKANFCLQSEVLSHPKALCRWITPRGTTVQCTETQYLWGKRYALHALLYIQVCLTYGLLYHTSVHSL